MMRRETKAALARVRKLDDRDLQISMTGGYGIPKRLVVLQDLRTLIEHAEATCGPFLGDDPSPPPPSAA